MNREVIIMTVQFTEVVKCAEMGRAILLIKFQQWPPQD